MQVQLLRPHIVTPAAPPVYRPHPVPRVLQTKMPAPPPRPDILSRGVPVASPVHRLELTHRVLSSSLNNNQPKMKSATPQPRFSTAGPVVKRATVQRFSSRIVQATKFYPNLHPGAVEPVDPSNIFRLNSFADQYRLHKVHSHGVNVPNQQYNFVRTGEGEMLLHSRYRHPSIAAGKQVLYAGEIFFNNGKLQWWSNGSGHYQPYVDDAEQANLPMDHFFSYQQIIKGEHTRKKG